MGLATAGCGAWSAGGAHHLVVESSVRGPTGFDDGALVGICYTISRICCWLRSMYWLLWASTLFSALPYPKIIQLFQSSQCYGREEIEMGFLGSTPQVWGRGVLTWLSRSPVGKYWPPQSLLALEEGWLFLSLSVLLFFYLFFAPLVCRNLSAILPGFHKGILIHKSLWNPVSVGVWGMDILISSS